MAAAVTHLIQEITEMASFPGINRDRVLKELEEAGLNASKLEALYEKLLEDCYGDDNYL
jgi:hypothetical protein